MIKKFLFLLLPIYLFGVVNPYTDLKLDEKVNLLANYFFNEELKTKLPKKPKKQEQEELGDIPPIKYEQYFAYIQRLKALKSAWEDEEKKINEKYEGQVGYYNGNMKTLYKFYKKKENQIELIQNSINKTLKVFFGKPKIVNLEAVPNSDIITADLFSNDFYGYGYVFKRKIKIKIPIKEQKDFLERYRRSLVIVRIEYEDNTLNFIDSVIHFEGKKYFAKFENNFNEKIKLDIKINDDIFAPIKITLE